MSTYILALEVSAARRGKYHVEHASVRVKAPSPDAARSQGLARARGLDLYASHADAFGWTVRAEVSVVGMA